MDATKQRGRSSTKVVGLAIFIAVLWLATATGWAQQDRCVTAAIPAQFVLPDDTVHAAGDLKLCVVRTHSPIAKLHRAYVDGMPVASFVSRTGTGEADAREEPFILFHRNVRDQLELIGYASRRGSAMHTHVLAERVTRAETSDRVTTGDHEEFVLVAAR